MIPFIEIPAEFLRRIATGPQENEVGDVENTPVLYFHPNPGIRISFWLRLRWIVALIDQHVSARGSVCDFGGGGGVLLPTLAGVFNRVVCVDRKLDEAREVRAHYQLENVELVDEDITSTKREEAFDCIIAADVLEHFQDLSVPVSVIERWLSPSGFLMTSLPTENFVYVLLRLVFRVKKPEDHYHTAAQVEQYLSNRGFEKVARRYVPLRIALFPLFRITAWRLVSASGAVQNPAG